MMRLLSFAQRHKRRLNIQLGENLGYLGAWDRRSRHSPFFCPVGFLACCIGVDGRVRGCPEQPDVPENQEGSILEESFAGIWRRGFRKYRDRELLKDDNCRACRSRRNCSGGCWVMKLKGMHCPVKRYKLGYG
jgi:radical SAM protein with 4Fe4S-binding SPASM domain